MSKLARANCGEAIPGTFFLRNAASVEIVDSVAVPAGVDATNDVGGESATASLESTLPPRAPITCSVHPTSNGTVSKSAQNVGRGATLAQKGRRAPSIAPASALSTSNAAASS